MELMVEPTIDKPVAPTSTDDVVTTIKDEAIGVSTSTTTTKNKDWVTF